MIKITGDIEGFRRALRREHARVDRAISKWYFDKIDYAFKILVEQSAQWSGNMAANWNYGVGAPVYRYEQIANKTGSDAGIQYIDSSYMFGVFERGHPAAVEQALSRARAVRRTTWRDKVYFTNVTPMDDQSQFLQEAIERGNVKLRPVNLVNGVPVTLYNLETRLELEGWSK